MVLTFKDVVDIINNLQIEEKEEIRLILDKSIVEQRRDKIHQNFLKSKKEFKSGRMKFSNDINELKTMLD